MAKNNNNAPVDAQVNTKKEIETKKETKVVAIPVNPLNQKDDKVKVIINGRETVIKRGVQQKVSEAVYERLVIAGLIVEK